MLVLQDVHILDEFLKLNNLWLWNITFLTVAEESQTVLDYSLSLSSIAQLHIIEADIESNYKLVCNPVFANCSRQSLLESFQYLNDLLNVNLFHDEGETIENRASPKVSLFHSLHHLYSLDNGIDNCLVEWLFKGRVDLEDLFDASLDRLT